MDFVTAVFAQWVLELLADAGRGQLVRFLLGEEQERALRGAAATAIELTARTFYPDEDPQTEYLAMVIDQVFSDPAPVALTAHQGTLLQALHDGIAAQLAPLENVELTEVGQSSLELLGVPGAQLAERLASNLVREIIGRGARGGPLASLANQLDHDATHLQGQVLEAKLDRIILDVEEALGALFKTPCYREEEERTGGIERVIVGGVRAAIVGVENFPVLEVADKSLDRRAKR